jgi:predicted nucleic acid-binding protein
MIYLLDTNSCIKFLNGRSESVRRGPNDLLIAAIALNQGVTLVPHNTGEFSRVEALLLEDWE